MKIGTKIEIGSNVRNIDRIDCGLGAPVRVIANIGVTFETDSIDKELDKAKRAFEAGADIVTDHSVAGDIESIHKRLLSAFRCPISTVSIYEAYVNAKLKNKGYFDPDNAIKTFEKQASEGFDLITLHATILKEDLPRIAHSKRIIPIASRGGTMMADLMIENNIENPYWTYFEDILEIAKKYRTSLSLGTAFRPASILDLPDFLYKVEIKRMGALVKKALKNNVGIMVEGIGHARLDYIPRMVKEAKRITYGVPYRVLCVACDSALYRDHIASAIASAVAVAAGADVISAVTRSEHVRRPTINDVIEAVETAKIAAHCGDIVRRGNLQIDKEISIRRNKTTCLARGAPTLLQRPKELVKDYTCTMCGPYCALRIMRKIKKVESKIAV